MDVSKTSFASALPAMLEAIATAHFVAIDLELSGIPKQLNRRRAEAPVETGKQTLQQRYKETKAAAERYQVLQLGLTCVEEDRQRGVYVARPFNFNVSPLIDEGLGIERDITFQGGAIAFLLSHGYSIEAPFKDGVPYLSRKEEAAARRIAMQRPDRMAFADINLREEDVEAVRFVSNTRALILSWKAQPAPRGDFLNISAPDYHADPHGSRGLNSFQKRLVHQLVRAEFPEFVSVSRGKFIQLIPYDKGREDKINANRTRRFDEHLARHIGLRWLVEAMTTGDLSEVDPRWFAKSATGEPMFIDTEAVGKQFEELRQRLKSKVTVLVGHNLFTDLIYLYQTFIGELPEDVETFQQIVHQRFPLYDDPFTSSWSESFEADEKPLNRIIDTKFMMTQNSGSTIPKSSLEDAAEDLRNQHWPDLQTHFDYPKYLTTQPSHEAGYDAFLTAQVMVKLSARLKFASRDSENLLLSPTEDTNSSLIDLHSSPREHSDSRPMDALIGPLIDAGGHSAPLETTSQPQSSPKRDLTPPPPSRAGRYDSVIDWADEVERQRIMRLPPIESSMAPRQIASRLMPPFDDVFWMAYINKLRVFGLGAITPLGVGVRRSWSRLIDGHCGIVSVKDRNPQFAGLPCQVAAVVPRGTKDEGGWSSSEWLTPGEERRTATFTHYALAASQEALEDSGWSPRSDAQREATGVCLGSGIGSLDDAYETSVAFEKEGYKKVSPLFVPRLLINLAAGHISMRYGLKGPNHAVTTACTTGAHSVGDASRFIAFGDADVMVAGGSESCIHPLAIAGFARSKSLATAFNDSPQKASRPFDRARDGFVIGEGAGVLVLEELEHAKARGARIYAEVKGYGTSADAHHITAPHAAGDGALLAMRRALKNAQVSPGAVDYVNAHATSTSLGDAAENVAIKRLLLGEQGRESAAQINVSSTKGAIGHLLGAAGAVEALFTVLALQKNLLPPTINLDDVGEETEGFDCNYVPHEAQERHVDIALSNSFGFGGTNASLCFARYTS
ncbi:MAG: Mitochondrial beta-keto-acyl synthase [Piccolia ochrophora]|nr:MAG: Mitochondrial beta-keto-acyl synthase [Piccolia ochrophora]